MIDVRSITCVDENGDIWRSTAHREAKSGEYVLNKVFTIDKWYHRPGMPHHSFKKYFIMEKVSDTSSKD